ncbi:MAG: thiamine pyrophosphate-binding protein [Steroidobacteraceae bacterium]
MSERTSGGEAIVDALLRNGVDTVFGIPGVQTYGLFDAMQRAGNRLRVIHPRHEQATAYMAFGYAKTTGRAGVFSVVPGPGVLNAGAAVCTAYGASTPLLCLTGQVPGEFIGSGKGHLHELPDQLATMRSIMKWAARIDHPGEAPAVMADAFAQLNIGRPRPVAVEMPWDVFASRAPVTPIEPPASYPQVQPDPELIAQAARLLAGARNPMIMVGSGAQHAAAEVLELAELLQAPVVPLRSGRGVVSDEHHLGFTCAAGFQRWRDTDVLVGIGSRLELTWFRWPKPPQAPALINIDIDPTQMPRLKPAVPVVGDARVATRALSEALLRVGKPRASRREEFTAIKARTRAAIQKVQPHMAYLDVMREVLPRDGFFVEEICQAGFTSIFGFPIYQPRTFVTSGCQGTLGFGYPTALGVKAAHPGKAVLSVNGDGGLMFGIQELATAAQHKLGVVAVVFNNNAFGNVMRDQQERFGGRVIGSELRNPDFVRLAESCGVAGYRVGRPAELRGVLERAFAADAPALIEVPVDRKAEVSPWEFLMPPAIA